ncbi:cytochrome b/b6 domain-containing protein [Novosphingobium sp.]|uniref:cytochrome b/b6 domain-containing protein n=1 Tax=Novosphingobium sp. TaxID=1874826 RepID=UPI0035B0CE1D
MEQAEPRGGDLVRRHGWPTRAWHWLNLLAMAVLLMSGLMIFNAHPRLYWGEAGSEAAQAWLDLWGQDGLPFPGWITIPSAYNLADARLWHFFFAWLLAPAWVLYLGWNLRRWRLTREVLPRRADLAPAHLWQDLRDHLALRFPRGAAALRYKPLQKLAYAAVLAGLIPLVIVTGMAMSPALDAALRLTVALGGRATARSLHFLAAGGLVAFFVVHLAMVLLAGPINGLRAMLTGWYRLPKERG